MRRDRRPRRRTTIKFLSNEALCATGPASQDLSRLFRGKTAMAQRFGASEWATGPSEAPILAGAAVSFDCPRVQVSSVGTHDILIL
jgi:flavin reductase